MKLIIIDDVTYVGSANFDARSLFVNVEIMLRIADAEFAARMRDFVASMEGECEIVTKESHKARAGLLPRLRWTLAWFVVGVAAHPVHRRPIFGLPHPVPEPAHPFHPATTAAPR